MNKEVKIGDKFGKLKVKELLGKISNTDRAFYCIVKCECGNEERIQRRYLLNGERYMCKKCKLIEMSNNNRLDIRVGDKFGDLTVIQQLGKIKKGSAFYYKVRCKCGIEENAKATDLNMGIKKHCIKCGIKNGKNYKHGLIHTKLYTTWLNIITRCCNRKYKEFHLYGGRGIKICEEWKNDFKNFYDWAISNGYKENLSIDRIDNNGNYEPSNCRWATAKEQANNRRSNRNITINGETHNIEYWCTFFNINRSTVNSRLRRGWKEGKAITTPPHYKK